MQKNAKDNKKKTTKSPAATKQAPGRRTVSNNKSKDFTPKRKSVRPAAKKPSSATKVRVTTTSDEKKLDRVVKSPTRTGIASKKWTVARTLLDIVKRDPEWARDKINVQQETIEAYSAGMSAWRLVAIALGVLLVVAVVVR